MDNSHTKFNLLNINALVENFKQRRVGEYLKFKYLLAEIILITTLASISMQTPPADNLEWVLYSVLLLFMIVIGTIYAYKQNKQGDNSDFIARYIAVSFVITIRFIITLSLIGAVFGVFAAIAQNFDGLIITLEESVVFNLILNVLITGLYYYLVGKYVREIATARE